MGFGGFFVLKIVVLFLMRDINSKNLNILSSQDTNNTKSNTKHKNLNVSYTVYGTNSGFGGFFVLKIVVLFLMRGWSYIFTIKGQRPIFS
jgi:hypothetical protein